MNLADLKLLYKLIIFRIKMIVIIVGVATSIAMFVMLMEKPVFLSQAKLLIVSPEKSSWLDLVAPGLEETRKNASDEFETELLLMQSNDTVQKVIAEIYRRIDMDPALTPLLKYKKLIKASSIPRYVRILRPLNTNIISVKVFTPHPVLSYIIADIYSRFVLDQNMATYQSTNKKAREMLEEQVENSKKKIDEYQKQYNTLKLYSVATTEKSENGETTIVGTDINVQVSQLNVELKVAKKVKQDLQREFENGGEAYIPYLKNPILSNMIEKRDQLKKQLSQSPSNLQLQESYEVIQKRIHDELIAQSKEGNSFISGYYDNLFKQLQLQDETIQKLISKLDILKAEQRESMERMVKNSSTYTSAIQVDKLLQMELGNYNILIKDLQGAKMSEEMNLGNLKLVEPAALNLDSVHTGKKVKVLLIFLVSTVISIGIVILRNFLENIFDVYDELLYYKDLALPLGYIPISAHGHKLIKEELPRSVYVEAYKDISAELRLHYQPCKAIVFSSIDKIEEAEMVAINFAINEAISGKKVILIDANYRRPSIASKLGISHPAGLSDFLSGTPTSAKPICDTPFDRLQFIGTGEVPGNPIDLLIKDRFGVLVNLLKQQCDLIVFYLPPANLFSDTMIVARESDGVILIIKELVSKVSHFKLIASKFRGINIPILGSVMYGKSDYSKSKTDYMVTTDTTTKSTTLVNIIFYVTIVLCLIAMLTSIGSIVMEKVTQKTQKNLYKTIGK